MKFPAFSSSSFVRSSTLPIFPIFWPSHKLSKLCSESQWKLKRQNGINNQGKRQSMLQPWTGMNFIISAVNELVNIARALCLTASHRKYTLMFNGLLFCHSPATTFCLQIFRHTSDSHMDFTAARLKNEPAHSFATQSVCRSRIVSEIFARHNSLKFVRTGVPLSNPWSTCQGSSTSNIHAFKQSSFVFWYGSAEEHPVFQRDVSKDHKLVDLTLYNIARYWWVV